MNTQRVLATFLVAVLVTSVFAAVGIMSPRMANAQAVTIETSADGNGGSFFGEGVLQVIITDPSADDDNTQETITVNIQGTPETGASGTGSFTVPETSRTSGVFEFFLVHEDANDVSLAALDPVNPNNAASYETTLGQTSPNIQAPVIQFGPSVVTGANDLQIAGAPALTAEWEDIRFELKVGNVQKNIDYEEQDGTLTLDRETSYGSTSKMHVFINDNDANLNPTATDSFTVSSTNLNDANGDRREVFTIVGGNFPDDVTFTETGDNTAEFEAVIQLNSTSHAGVDDEFVFSSEAIQMTLNDKAQYTIFSGGAVGATTNNTSTATSSVSFDVDDVDGEFDEIGALTFASELKLTLRDTDRNIDSETQERIRYDSATGNGVVVLTEAANNGDTAADREELTMEETDDNTGVFAIDLANDELRITFLGVGQTPTRNNGILELRESDITEDILIQYRDPADDDSASSITSFLTREMTLQNGKITLPETTGINDDFTITITDSDLNDNPRTRDSYTVTFTGTGSTNTAFLHMFNFTRGGVNIGPLATLEVDIEGSFARFGSATTTETFTETGINTGIFTTDFDMEFIADNAKNAAGNALDLDDGDKVRVTYNDLMDDTTRESSDEISIGRAGTEVDFSRTTLPIPPRSNSATGSLVGTQVFTTLLVTDPDQNKLTNAEDTLGFTLGTGNGQFEIEVDCDGDVTTVTSLADFTSTTADAICGTSGSSTVELSDILDNDGNTATAPTSVPISLTETGKTTGVFDDEIAFFNGGLDTDNWHNLEITITYHDSSGDEESAGITFRGNDGSVTVDQNAAKAGTIVTITVEDQDLNLDDEEAEEFEGSVEATGNYLLAVEAEDDDIDQTNTETFRETGPDTGVFEAQYEVGDDIDITELESGDDEVTQATNILITYNDEIDSTGNSGDEIEVNLPIVTSTGAIQITPELVGPGTELTVLIIDADLDKDSSATNDYDSPSPNSDDFFVSFRSDRSEVGDASPDLEETGPNTGVFEFTIELITNEEDCENDNLRDSSYDARGGSEPRIGACPGDLISIRYEDQQTAGGRSTTVSQVVEVKSWDPEFVSDKDSYSVGDRVTVTISDPDANRDPDIADSLTDIRVFSTSDAVGEELSALETGKSTGVFRLSFTLSADTSGGAITVKQGDRVTIEYTDAFPADFEDEEDDKEFQFNINVAGKTGTDATTPSKPALKDVTGRTLSSLSVGQQAVLSTTVVNNNDEPRPFVALVEVRDSDGITVFLAWQTGTLNPSGQTEVGLSWTPENSGNYEVRTFVISDLQNPQVLSSVSTSNISVSG